MQLVVQCRHGQRAVTEAYQPVDLGPWRPNNASAHIGNCGQDPDARYCHQRPGGISGTAGVPTANLVALNHYASRSDEDFAIKIKREEDSPEGQGDRAEVLKARREDLERCASSKGLCCRAAVTLLHM
jgi:hypothetical protein